MEAPAGGAEVGADGRLRGPEVVGHDRRRLVEQVVQGDGRPLLGGQQHERSDELVVALALDAADLVDAEQAGERRFLALSPAVLPANVLPAA